MMTDRIELHSVLIPLMIAFTQTEAASSPHLGNLKTLLYFNGYVYHPHINCDENGAFRKRFSNWRNLKTRAFHFRVDGKYLENGAFRKRLLHDDHVISLTEFSQTQIQND